MSTPYVRTQIKNFLSTKVPSEKYVDFTAGYDTLDDLLSENSIGPLDEWVGLEFVGDDEQPVTVPATNDSGKYRETGSITIDVVGVARLGVADDILARGEILRGFLRGQRIDRILINSVAPVNFGRGAALEFDSGYISGSFLVSYTTEFDL